MAYNTLKILLSFYFFFNSNFLLSQLDAQIKGGNWQLEQVLQTQLNLPKIILTSNFDETFQVFFKLNEKGEAKNIEINKSLNNVIKNEINRLFKFLYFEAGEGTDLNTTVYFLNINLSTKKYNSYLKQHNKSLTAKSIVADSTFIIYTKAEKSPEYYKNGEEGLNNFFISNLEYPSLAKEKSIQGTVVLEFIVESNGYTTNIIPIQKVSGGCTEEAIRLLKLTKWKPAILNEKYVRYKHSYSITFDLKSINRENATSGQSMGQF
ncbi:MAG: energy transducer TonB [Bacteroidetes bacterium]|nr:energy transducer TonB [Bacteroidota bacterium]